MKKVSVSIGLPTYELNSGIIVTLESIYNQTYFPNIDKVILVVDGKKVPAHIRNKIKNNKLEIVEFSDRKGQSRRINDILRISKSDFTILTNDDVYIEANAIENLVKNSDYDLIAGCARPTQVNNLFAKIVNIGVDINHRISSNWGDGDNYLGCNGRLLMISKELRKLIQIPDNLWNNDSYIYLVCKLNKLKFKHEEKSLCFYQAPQKLSDHIKQSVKFQNSFKENSRYVHQNLLIFYSIPFLSKMKALLQIFLKKPFGVFGYVLLLIYSRQKKNSFIKTGSFWQTDKSTKEIKLIH